MTPGQLPRFEVGRGPISIVFDVKYFLQKGEDRDKVMSVGVPFRVSRGKIKNSLFADVRVINFGVERDFRKGVGIIVSLRQFHCEFEDGVGVHSSAEKYDAVE